MIRKVTAAEIQTHFGVPQAGLAAGIPTKPTQPKRVIYDFEFQTISKADATGWKMEAKQREGWQLLSASRGGDDNLLLTWRRPSRVQ